MAEEVTYTVSWYDITEKIPLGQGETLEPDGEPYFDQSMDLVVTFVRRTPADA